MNDRQKNAPSIRRATVEDADTIAALVDALNRHFEIDDAAFPADLIRPLMDGPDPMVFGFLVETADGKPMGYALCQKFIDTDIGMMATWILDLYVDAALRGGGIGRKLLAAVAADAKAKGLRSIGWGVYQNNRARHLYDRIGAAMEDNPALIYELRDGRLDALAAESQI